MTGGYAGKGVASDKSADAYRTITEVAAELDLPQHVLRFWETRFPQLRPLKRAGGRRYYRPADLALLRQIRGLLHDDGYTIKGVQRLLRPGGTKVADAPAGGGTAEAAGAGGEVVDDDRHGPDDGEAEAQPASTAHATTSHGGRSPAQPMDPSAAGSLEVAGVAALRQVLTIVEECERRLRAAIALGD